MTYPCLSILGHDVTENGSFLNKIPGTSSLITGGSPWSW